MGLFAEIIYRVLPCVVPAKFGINKLFWDTINFLDIFKEFLL